MQARLFNCQVFVQIYDKDKNLEKKQRNFSDVTSVLAVNYLMVFIQRNHGLAAVETQLARLLDHEARRAEELGSGRQFGGVIRTSCKAYSEQNVLDVTSSTLTAAS